MTTSCNIQDCDQRGVARGLCPRHYQAWRRNSRVLPLPPPKTREQRFWSKVRGASYEACWTWHGSRTPDGYGRFVADGGVLVGAHRWAYEHMVGEIPEGLHLDHLCRHPSCVNPWHLDPVTPLVNTRRSPLSNAGKTHCPRGHEYTSDNTYRHAGRRTCLTCRDEYQRQYRAAEKVRRAETWKRLGVSA